MSAILQMFADAIPVRPVSSVVKWAEENVRLPGSARSERFDSSITPWTRAPMECADDGVTRVMTFVKPVQAGGSVVGEVALCRWLATKNSGDVQYNWQTNDKAGDRWVKRIERILKKCEPVMRRAPSDMRRHWTKGLVMFPHCNLTVQGIHTEANVASDSICYQINEEIHDAEGWLPGRLQQAYNRTTAFWNSIILNISNAGYVGDQLHQAFESGTQEHWEVKCPGCGLYHVMRTEWDPKRPDLGGLRYESKVGTRSTAPPTESVPTEYNYNLIAPTIRYQMPCGFLVRDTPSERRQLSLNGRYSEPRNAGAHRSNRSFTLEAVSVDYIPWLKLIQEKHAGLKAMRMGDPSKYCDYVRERESRFWDPQNRPLVGKVVINSALRKNREGLLSHKDFFARYFALDRQQGSLRKGDTPHWWLLIRDALSNGDSQLVFEGKVETDENVIAILDEHKCLRRLGVADSGDDTVHVYQFCYRWGINAIKGGKSAWFSHGDEGNKIFAPEQPLHTMMESPPKYDYERDPADPNKFIPHIDEPMFWLYSKVGIRDRLGWLRAGGAVRWDVPDDVNEDYKRHMEAEELEEMEVGRTQERQNVYVQHADRNDLYVCECYIAMLMEKAGLIGAGVMTK